MRRASRGRYTPTFVMIGKRLRALGYEERADGRWVRARRASTRVDETPATPSTTSETIPTRTRAPLAVRVAPPNVNVIALPLAMTERHPDGVEGLLRDLLCAIPPGWSWSVADFEETRADAIACARHQATLRGDAFEVVEVTPAQPAIVLVRSGDRPGRTFALVVVRYSRAP